MENQINVQKATEYLLGRQMQRDVSTGVHSGDTDLYEHLSHLDLLENVDGIPELQEGVYYPSASIIGQVIEELKRAEKIHPEWPTDIIYQASILQEETGEAVREANNYQIEGEEGAKAAFEKEVIQTAAMCLRILKNL